MDAADVADLFAPFGPVRIKRMFGGLGVWADDVMFALVFDGEVYARVDDGNRALFAAEECAAFSYTRGAKVVELGYRRLPADAFDDADRLTLYAEAALEAARRKAAAKTKRRAGR